MRKTPIRGGNAVGFALIYLLTMGAVSADNSGDGDFRLLKFEGYHVKWGDKALGTGATVSYAFTNTRRHFDDARNCPQLVPMGELKERSGISAATLREETAAAFRAWEEAANIAFVSTANPDRADILIGAQGEPVGRAYANVAYRPGGDNGVKIIDRALVCLNPKQRWKVGFDGDTDVYDLRYTLIHEIGHAIGLDHPSPSGQVMSFRYNEAYRNLQPGDFRGVETLYGVNTTTVIAGDSSD